MKLIYNRDILQTVKKNFQSPSIIVGHIFKLNIRTDQFQNFDALNIYFIYYFIFWLFT